MRRTKTDSTAKVIEVTEMQLIQIGNPEPKPTVTIREMFQQMASREAEMVRAARQRIEIPSTRKRTRA